MLLPHVLRHTARTQNREPPLLDLRFDVPLQTLYTKHMVALFHVRAVANRIHIKTNPTREPGPLALLLPTYKHRRQPSRREGG